MWRIAEQKKRRLVSAETIARLADKGRDISKYFTNKGRMIAKARLPKPGVK